MQSTGENATVSDGRGLGAKLECDRDERDDASPATFEISQTHSEDKTFVKRAMNASPRLFANCP